MTGSNHRAHVLNLLANHKAQDEEEHHDVHFIREFVEANEDCFGKVNPHGHITGSAFVIEPTGRVLMTFHRTLQRWLQLGGHGTAAETDPADTALREAVEESGLVGLQFHPNFGRVPFDIDMHMIPARKREVAHPHLDFRYVFTTDSPADIVCSEESSALEWLSREQLEDMPFDPALKRALRKLWTL